MSLRAYSRAEVTRRLFNAPLQVLSDTAAIVIGAVGARYDVGQLFVAAEGRTLPIGELQDLAANARIEISSRAGVDQLAPKAAAGDLMRVIEGVAHIEVRGELVSENGIGPSSGFTGYDGIRAQVIAADADSGVKGLLLDIDSPGGEVAGLYECVKVLMDRRGTKPLRAVIRGCGASAAYALAACADEITLNPLGIAGSVGTIAMHADFSQQLANEGVKVTLIMAGAHKADGNPFEPLPDDVRDRIASMVNMANDQFIGHVAAARGILEDQVRAQEAQVFRGEEAVAAGLADKVMSWADSINEFVAQVKGGVEPDRTARSAPGARSKETKMDETQTAPAGDQPAFSQSTQDAAVTAAVSADRARVGQLIELDAETTASPALTAAIADGASAGEFAIALTRASASQQKASLEGARDDAAKPGQLPNQRADAVKPGTKINRGEAAVSHLRGKHPGLPAAD